MKMKFCPWCGAQLKVTEVDGRERPACSSASCQYVHWDNPTPVVAALVEHNGQILLVRNVSWPKKMFGLVTGFLEREETPEDGVLREVKEELGLEGEIAGFIGYYAFFQMNQLILAFHIKAQGNIVRGEEIAAIKPVLPDDLRPWPFGTGQAVSDWLEQRKPRDSQ